MLTKVNYEAFLTSKNQNWDKTHCNILVPILTIPTPYKYHIATIRGDKMVKSHKIYNSQNQVHINGTLY